MNRRMMMGGRKYLIKYSDLTTFGNIQLNGEGEKITGSGEIEVKSGNYILCYANAAGGSIIKKDGVVVAESNSSLTYEFYPKADSKIEKKNYADGPGGSIVIHLVITTL